MILFINFDKTSILSLFLLFFLIAFSFSRAYLCKFYYELHSKLLPTFYILCIAALFLRSCQTLLYDYNIALFAVFYILSIPALTFISSQNVLILGLIFLMSCLINLIRIQDLCTHRRNCLLYLYLLSCFLILSLFMSCMALSSYNYLYF